MKFSGIAVVAASLLLAGCVGLTSAADLGGRCDVPQHYSIDFARWDEAAQQIAHATGCFIVMNTEATGSVKPNPVEGVFTPREAVALAIKGTGLRITQQKPNSISVK
ncbi:MAG: hypothetical protein P8011_11100 [Acidihalobacter sp.]|uniref:STN domain-containing protein n=1 Tax=Acidihalobacter sp. TaxID=1872108 RepID=UPI00307D4DF1